MKRDILCIDCNSHRIKSLGYPIVDTPLGFRLAVPIEPNMEHESISGKAIMDLHCDLCGVQIAKGTQIVAVSTYFQSEEYFSWESNYVQV